MTGADWIILVVILLSLIEAASAGFFQEAFAIAGLIFGYLLAAWNYHRLADHFVQYSSSWLVEIAAFLIIFLGVLILAGIAGRVAHWLMKEAGLNVVDRFLGGALGVVRGCLIVAIVLTSMAAFTPTSKWLRGSELAPYFLVVGRAAIWVAPPELRGRFYQGIELLKHAQQEMESRSKGSGK
ncbi:MAG: CvpA family protein [Terriglobales bacterium]